MTEGEYVVTSMLARVRAVQRILHAEIPAAGISEGEIRVMHRLLFRWEMLLNETVMKASGDEDYQPDFDAKDIELPNILRL